MLSRMTVRERLLVLLLAVVGLLGLTAACMSDPERPSAQEDLADQRQDTMDFLEENFPVSTPDYSNDRLNLDFWADTWGTASSAEGRLSYVYLMDMEGDLVGYYILDGLPTAKCRMSTPPYEFQEGDLGEYGGEFLVDAPSLSGTWGGGGECNIYFGKDATTGAYVEWMSGGGLNQLVYDQPLPLPDGVEPPMPLGFTELGDV